MKEYFGNMEMIGDKRCYLLEETLFNDEEIKVSDIGYSYTYRIYLLNGFVTKTGEIQYKIKGVDY